MKKWFAFLYLLSIGSFCFAPLQTGNCYFNLKQLQANHIDTSITFTTKYYKQNYEMAFRTNRDALTNLFAIHEVYAININDTLWLNGKKQKIGNRYYRALTKGNFIAFKGKIENSHRWAIVIPLGIGFGIGGGIITDIILSTKRIYHVLSLRTGNTRRLTPKYIEQRLKEIPNIELLNKYKAEKGKKSPEVLLKYVALLNEYVAANPVTPNH